MHLTVQVLADADWLGLDWLEVEAVPELACEGVWEAACASPPDSDFRLPAPWTNASSEAAPATPITSRNSRRLTGRPPARTGAAARRAGWGAWRANAPRTAEAIQRLCKASFNTSASRVMMEAVLSTFYKAKL